MFIYPFLFGAVASLAASPRLMGIYTGATVHELAGVVAAGNAMGAEVANTAIITKLLRVFLLEPWIIALYYLGIGHPKDVAKDATGKKGKGVPWFAFGFIGVAAYNSIWGIPAAAQKLFTSLSAAFLASAMAALGLDTDLSRSNRSAGSRSRSRWRCGPTSSAWASSSRAFSWAPSYIRIFGEVHTFSLAASRAARLPASSAPPELVAAAPPAAVSASRCAKSACSRTHR